MKLHDHPSRWVNMDQDYHIAETNLKFLHVFVCKGNKQLPPSEAKVHSWTPGFPDSCISDLCNSLIGDVLLQSTKISEGMTSSMIGSLDSGIPGFMDSCSPGFLVFLDHCSAVLMDPWFSVYFSSGIPTSVIFLWLLVLAGLRDSWFLCTSVLFCDAGLVHFCSLEFLGK